MKYFVVSKDREVVGVESYLNQAGINQEFARFIRREALGEVAAEHVKEKPRYLERAAKFGFRWEPNAESGHVQYDYKANLMCRLVMGYARMLDNDLELPVYEVNGANMFNLNHPVVKSYAALFNDRLYKAGSGGSGAVMSYDASYPQFNLASQAQLSYRHLPFAHLSIADCYRYEQRGELMLLMRQRRFFMPDLHAYFLNKAQAFDWFPRLQAKILESVEQIGRSYQVIGEVPSQEVWLENRKYIEKIPQWLGADILINILNDYKPRYWVINVDYKIIDQLGQAREIACIQVDIGNAARLGIDYADEKANRQHPVIIHSAIPGGIERYLYAAFDKAEGLVPQWLNPVQARLLAVNDDHVQACQRIVARYANRLRVEIDDRQQSIKAKVRRAHNDLVGRALVVGDRELADNGDLMGILEKESHQPMNLPFLPRQWPAELSRQI